MDNFFSQYVPTVRVKHSNIIVTQPTTSVAIATYNGEAHIADLIGSIASQEILPNEIIISDDCSTDNTVDAARVALQKSGLVYSIHTNKARLGFENNFLQAIHLCKGDLIFISDQDDIWLSNKIKCVMYAIKNHLNVLLAVHDAYICDSNLWLTSESLLKTTKRSTDKFSFGFTMTITRNLANVLPKTGAPLGHDLIINEIARCFNAKIFIPNQLAIYKRHPAAYTLANRKFRNGFNIKPVFCMQDHCKSISFYSFVLSCADHISTCSSLIYEPNNKHIQHLSRMLSQAKVRVEYMKKSSFSRVLYALRALISRTVPPHKVLKDLISKVHCS